MGQKFDVVECSECGIIRVKRGSTHCFKCGQSVSRLERSHARRSHLGPKVPAAITLIGAGVAYAAWKGIKWVGERTIIIINVGRGR
jgi:hypothetical protein